MPSTGGPAAPAAPARQPRLGGGRADQGPGARQESLRRHNLAVVYQLVAGAPQPLSRAEIAERAGVTRATATSLVDQLVASRLVEELDARLSGRAGRPARPVCPARGTVIGLGLEVNVDYLGVRAIDLAGDVVAERVVSGDLSGRAPAETLTRLATAAKTVRRAAVRRGARIAGAALAVPGPVDRPLGPLRLAPNLGWVDVDVAGMLGRLLGATPLVRVDNEACLAARAERHARVRREQVPGYSPASGPPAGGFIYVSGGIGIGAGIVEASGMYAGAHGWAGELGHVAVYPQGRECRCGATGCLEQYAGRRAIATGAGLAANTGVEELGLLAAGDHREVLRALRLAGTALGIALAGAVNLVDIPVVVLGGDLAVLSTYVSGPIAAELRRRVLASRWSADGAVLASVAPALPAMTGAALAVTDRVAGDPAAYLGAP